MNAEQAEVAVQSLDSLMRELGRAAAESRTALAQSSGETRNRALHAAALAIRERQASILAANARDMDAARARNLSSAMLDRLQLNEKRVEAMAAGIELIAQLPDPIGAVSAEWTRPNGLVIQRVRVPLGVIGIIYESRPNVTADAGALCLKSANPVILRGGSESRLSSAAIHECLVAGLKVAGLPPAAIQIVPTTDRAAVGMMLAGLDQQINVIVPRGGRSLVERVQKEARVPVIGHLEGLCHVYVDAAADPAMAREIVLNAKLRRTGICGAAETLLVDRHCAADVLPMLLSALAERGCELRGDSAAQAADARVKAATETDYRTEYLDAIMSVRVVDGVDGAMEHIAKYGSAHTDSIVTANAGTAARFLREVDSAIVLHNASTQFADGGEFGMGAEIGIATGRFHARGPVGLEQLTTFKYRVHGAGQVRPG